MDKWVQLVPGDLPLTLYRRDGKRHKFCCEYAPGHHDEPWCLTNAEALAFVCLLPEVAALMEAARRLSAEARPARSRAGEPPEPEFIIDPQTLAELDIALAALEADQ